MPRHKKEGDPFKDVADKIEGLEMAEKRHRRWVARKCDWDDPDDVAHMKRMDRNDVRQALLDRLVPDRKCPDCRMFVVKNRQWVVNKRRSKAICRKCFNEKFIYPKMKLRDGEKGVAGMSYIQLRRVFKSTGDKERFIFNCVVLEQALQLAGHTKASFSRRCGWSPSWTSQMMNPERVKTVNADTARVILQVLGERDIVVAAERVDVETLFSMGIDATPWVVIDTEADDPEAEAEVRAEDRDRDAEAKHKKLMEGFEQ